MQETLGGVGGELPAASDVPLDLSREKGLPTMLLALSLVSSNDPPPALCDLSGEWLYNRRTGGGMPSTALPASVATTITVKQVSGLFDLVSSNATITGWARRKGRVDTNRHVTTWLPEEHPAAMPLRQPVQQSSPAATRNDLASWRAPAGSINCTTATSCGATCNDGKPGGSACSDGVYYCCGYCTGSWSCPTNKGLQACACNPPPPAPLNLTNGTVQPQCSVVLWECGHGDGGGAGSPPSCEGSNPRTTWHKVDRGTTGTVHVVYMSHFDAGYTHDTSLEVLNEYYEKWFPAVYSTAAALRARGGEEQFAWTTHPWLITQMLANATGNVTAAQVAQLEAAIGRGDVTWQAGPMNLQAETADRSLFAHGLSLAARLDAAYNASDGGGGGVPQRKKTGMSQKDVPGSTLGIVPLAAAAGVRSFHVGVNDFSTPPAAPSRTPEMYEPCAVFRWKAPPASESGAADADELLCFWCSGYSQGYGPHAGLIPEMLVKLHPFGGTDALAFLMTVDNSGPQSAEEVLEGWRNLRLLFPAAKRIKTSSLEDFTDAAWKVRGALPAVTAELGDTWIRGTASDPTKARRFRLVARALAAAVAAGTLASDDNRLVAAYDQLIKLPEHTYGSNDGLVANQPWNNSWLDAHIANDSSFERTEAGWVDQRAYIDRAVAALADAQPLRAQIEAALAASEPTPVEVAPLISWPLTGAGGAR